MSPALRLRRQPPREQDVYQPQTAAMATISIVKSGSQGKYYTKPLSR
jgi:hypothetical protein